MSFRFFLIVLFFPSLLFAAAANPIVVPLSSIRQEEANLLQPVHQHREYAWKLIQQQKMFSQIGNTVIPQASFQRDSSAPFLLSQAPVLSLSFPANVFDNFTPADPIVAAGPNNVVTVVNTSIAIFNKSGQKLFSTQFKNWFAPLNFVSPAFYFDPKVLYDQYNGHFIFLCLAGRGSRSWVFLSVSKTADPRGKWGFWALDMGLANATRTGLEADFPGLGIDPQGIYITANMYAGDNFKYTQLRILKKSEVYSFRAIHWRDFTNLKEVTGQKAINVQPAHCFDQTPVEYLVETNAVNGNKLTIWKISNPTTSPFLSKRGTLVSSYGAPPSATQQGGGALINTGDSGVLNAVFRNGTIYTAHTTAHNWGSGNVAALRIYQVKPSGSVVQEITYGQDRIHYYYPAVMPDSRGNLAVVFNRSSSSEFVGIQFTGRVASDPPGTLQSSMTLRPGLSYYNDIDSYSGLDLWGDYNGIAWDSDDSFWIFSMFAKSPAKWGTQAGHIHF